MRRLADVDELIKYFAEDLEGYDNREYILQMLDVKGRIERVDAIPIDKPFLKMRYGDYVVYNKKWLVDHLQTEWNILQGKEYQPSIPVEWIEEWGWKNGMSESMSLRVMIDDWEKENEIDRCR